MYFSGVLSVGYVMFAKGDFFRGDFAYFYPFALATFPGAKWLKRVLLGVFVPLRFRIRIPLCSVEGLVIFFSFLPFFISLPFYLYRGFL